MILTSYFRLLQLVIVILVNTFVPFILVEAAGVISDIAKAIHYLHSMNIAHRDLKVRITF